MLAAYASGSGGADAGFLESGEHCEVEVKLARGPPRDVAFVWLRRLLERRGGFAAVDADAGPRG
jgi:hypothetical protein